MQPPINLPTPPITKAMTGLGLIAGFTVLAMAASLHGQIVTWDGGGGNNRWATNNNWNPNGQPGLATHVLFDNSSVATLPSTIQLRGNRSANSLTFDTGDTLTLINGTGNRTLTLNAGNITRTAGSSGEQGLSFTTLRLNSSGVFDINGTGSFTINSVVTGPGTVAITKEGDGLLVLTNNNTYNGLTTINDGVLRITHAGALGTTAGGTVVNAGGELQLAGGIAVANEFLTLGGGTLANQAGSNTWNANLNLSSGGSRIVNLAADSTLTLGTTGANRSIDTNGHTLILDGPGNILFNAQFNGTGGLIKEGTGTATLSYGGNAEAALSVYSGPTSVNAGTLILDLGSNSGDPSTPLTGDITVGDGTGTDTLELRWHDQIDDTGIVRINSSGVLNLNAGAWNTTLNEQIGGLVLEGGALVQTTDGAWSTATFTLNGDVVRELAGNTSANITGNLVLSQAVTTFNVADSAAPIDLDVSATIAGSGLTSLVKTGDGTLNLSGNNTFTAGLELNAGTLRVSADANLGNGSNPLTFDGGTLQAADTFTAGSGRVFTLGSGGGTIDVTAGHALTLGTSDQLTGSGGLTRTGAGNLVLSGANTGFTGDVVLGGGITRLEVFNALGSNTGATVTLNNGAELDAAFANNTNFQANLVINDGIIRRTNTSGTKSGFQNNNPNSSLTVNGTAWIIDQDGTGGPGGFLTLDGAVQLNSGASLTASAVHATDEVRFGGGQDITLAAGSTLTTQGSGLVSFGSGGARTIVGQGTSLQESTLALGAADHTSNAGSRFQVDGTGTGGLRIEGTQARVDGLVTDARLAATTGSGGTLTLAFTDAGNRTVGASANLATASSVQIGFSGNGGTFTVGTAGGPTGDLDNWGGLVVGTGATTVAFADDFVFNVTADLTLLGGTLALNGTSQSFANLNVLGDAVIDFGGGNSILSVGALNIASGVTLTIANWVDTLDFFTAQNWAGAVTDTRGESPMNRVVFTGFNANNTQWQGYDSQITPVPEPSTYGAILIALALAGVYLHRRQRKA